MNREAIIKAGVDYAIVMWLRSMESDRERRILAWLASGKLRPAGDA